MKQERQFIILQGIQGCGKSTWARQWVEEEPTKRLRLSNNDIRNMLGKYWVPERELFVTQMKYAFFKHAMENGYDIVVDNMNLNIKEVRALGDIINYYNSQDDAEYTYEPVFKSFFNVPLDECIRRDSLRPNPIGEEVIRATYERHKVAHGESIFHVNK